MSNLLPSEMQKKVFEITLVRNVVVSSIVFSFVGLVGIVALLPAYLTWSTRAESLSYESVALNGVSGYEVADYRADVVATNKRIKIIEDLFSATSHPSDAISKIISSRESGMSIQRFEYSLSNSTSTKSRMSISGTALSENDKTDFASNLRADPMFLTAEVPLSALARSDLRAFTIEVTGMFK